VACGKKPTWISQMLEPMNKYVFSVHYSNANKELTVGFAGAACSHEKNHFYIFSFDVFGDNRLIRNGNFIKMVMLKFIEEFRLIEIDPSLTEYIDWHSSVWSDITNRGSSLNFVFCFFLLT
jgi:hypothetical protein